MYPNRIIGNATLQPHDLLKTAKDLVRVRSGKPRQSNLRRAVSTAYYAVFHCLAKNCANLLIGTASASRSKPAWKQVYRALEHGQTKKNCTSEQQILSRFPRDIQDFANIFVDLQLKRHSADYDPEKTFYKSEVIQDIANVEDVIKRFESSSVKDRRAFAAFALFKHRRP